MPSARTCRRYGEEAAGRWADHHTAPPTLLIGYRTLRESMLVRGIEALAARVIRY